MTKLGHIRIKLERVWFEYYELEKPRKEDFFEHEWYLDELEEYEASNRTVEVSNNKSADFFNLDNVGKLETCWLLVNNKKYIIYNNQPCEAEITDKAKITKII